VSSTPDPRPDVAAYYTGRLREHGTTPRGVDWNSAASQEVRFAQLMKVCDFSAPFVLGDYGCGYGGMAEYLTRAGVTCEFRGYDIAPAMVEAANTTYGNDPTRKFSTDPAVLADCDFVVASGVFNVRLGTPLETWEAYVLETVAELNKYGKRGFAFNSLTSYSDADRMRPDLYYPDPCRLFDLCKRQYSRQVALLHDYGLYEFTILVRR